MSEDAPIEVRPHGQALEARREQTEARLQDAFANGTIQMRELEERLEAAHDANSFADLDQLLADLPGDALPVLADDAPIAQPDGNSEETALAVRRQEETAVLRAIFGGIERSGSWAPPPVIEAKAYFGGVELDLSEAQLLPESVTEIQCQAIFGGIEIDVPPHVRVEVDGSAFFGGFSQHVQTPDDPRAPIVRVTGHAIFGGVEVELKRERRPRKRRSDKYDKKREKLEYKEGKRRRKRGDYDSDTYD